MCTKKEYVFNLIPNKKNFWTCGKCLIKGKPTVPNLICENLMSVSIRLMH